MQQNFRITSFWLDLTWNNDHPGAKPKEKQKVKACDNIEDEFFGGMRCWSQKLNEVEKEENAEDCELKKENSGDLWWNTI